MIKRDLEEKLVTLAVKFPVLTLTGPRQSGKSTLCKASFPDHRYLNLERPDIRSFAQDDPLGFLGQTTGGMILDEIQRCPDLLSYIQVLVDEDPAPGRWILTGSQNLTLLEKVSQSLAGRSAVLHLQPCHHAEVLRFDDSPTALDDVLLAGGYPRIFDQRLDPSDWIASYVATYLQRDVRMVLNISDLEAFSRFLGLCAGRSGQVLNFSALASDAGISQSTAKAWLGVLETCFLVHRLPPFHANIRKRLIKMPKLYFLDTGLLCWLLGIRRAEQLRTHPLRGAIFETFVVSEIIKHRAACGEYSGLHFYRDKEGLEVDLLIDSSAGLILVEAKSGRTIASDMFRPLGRVRTILSESLVRQSVIVYGGGESQDRTDCRILPWNRIADLTWM